MSGLLDVFTISGGNIAGHLSSSHTTNQSSQFLITSHLPVLAMPHYCIHLF